MKTILVTGGTSPLGRPTVTNLRTAGHTVRVLSRQPAEAGKPGDGGKPGGGRYVGDLTTGAGIAAAVEGVDTVLHLATSRGHKDLKQAEHLIGHLAAVRHLIFVSIVGVDEIPMPYYRDKLAVERLVAGSSIPFTILRATQFHTLVDQVMSAQRFLPVLLAPAIPLQPISVDDVADRLTELAAGPPAGRVADLGGPEQLPVPDLATAWKLAKHSRRPIIPVRLPGKAFRAFGAGAGLTTVAQSNRTFRDYLDHRFGVQA